MEPSLNPAKRFRGSTITIENIPIDIKKMFLPTPDEMKAARYTNRAFKKASEERMMEWLNLGNPIASLLLSPPALENLLTCNKNKLQYFSSESPYNLKLRDVIKTCTNLTSLEVGRYLHESLNSGNKMPDLIAGFVVRFTQLKILKVTDVYLSNEATKAIVEKLPQLTVLNLKNNFVGNKGFIAIAKNLPQLRVLNLKYNKLTSIIGAPLTNLTQLEVLNLARNFLKRDSTMAVAVHLTQLRVLNLWRDEFHTDEAMVLASNVKQLTKLNLSEAGICINGVRAIAENLPQLVILYLPRSGIDSLGVKTIASRLTLLTKLMLMDNPIDFEGAQAIAIHLKQLKVLDLTGTNVGIEGVKLIAANLNQLTKLILFMEVEMEVAIDEESKREIQGHLKDCYIFF